DVPITPSDRVRQILSWLDLPSPDRPRLLLLYLDEVDHAGHDFGPRSAQVGQAIASVDRSLAELKAGLEQRGVADQVNVVVVSDHGMAEVPSDHFISLDNAFADLPGETAGRGAMVGFFPRGDPADAAARL